MIDTQDQGKERQRSVLPLTGQLRGYNAITLASITKDELSEDLSESGLLLDVDEIYQRIVVWRQDNGFDIINFAQIEVLEDWAGGPNTDLETPSSDSNSSNVVQESKTRNILSYPKSDLNSNLDTEPGSSKFSTSYSKTGNYSNIVWLPGKSCSKKLPNAIYLGVKTDPCQLDIIEENVSDSVVPLNVNQISTDLETVVPPRSVSPQKAKTYVKPTAGATQSPSVAERNSVSDSLQQPISPFSPSQLVSLLESSITGKSLLERSNQGEFSSQSQKELVGIIAEYHLSLGIKSTEDVLDTYATSIVLLFKQEKKESYFIRRCGGKRNPGGKIYNKIFNLKQKRAIREKSEEARQSKKTETQFRSDSGCGR